MSGITSHILDTAAGKPAAGVSVSLQRLSEGGQAQEIARAVTDADGRVKHFTDVALQRGDYRLVFDTRGYFAQQRVTSFYPEVSVTFTVRELTEHHHVPLLLNPFGYSTYRGS